MIFVTVGTHEQQFNRLIQEVDNLKRDGYIKEEVFIQTGYSTYKPKNCQWKSLLSYSDMIQYYKAANIIITHGGPASFMKALEYKKVPIVVPRQVEFDEHINNHQIDFVKFVEEKNQNIVGVYNINDLVNALDKASKHVNIDLHRNNKIFNQSLYDILKRFSHGENQ